MAHKSHDPGTGSDTDRRKRGRRPIRHTLLVRFKGDKIQFGRITDISPAGLGFRYNADWQKFTDRSLQIDLFDCFHGKVLEGLQVRVVYDKSDRHKIGGRPIIILENGASFEKLSVAQAKTLDSFIDKYGTQESEVK